MYLIKKKKETPVFYFHLLNNIKKKLQYIYKALKMDRDRRGQPVPSSGQEINYIEKRKTKPSTLIYTTNLINFKRNSNYILYGFVFQCRDCVDRATDCSGVINQSTLGIFQVSNLNFR